MINVSVIVITKNEEANIARCLNSVKWANQIIVLDSGSTDRTVEIAQQFTSQVYKTDWKGYGVQKQRALSFATSEWVLNLDADEMVDAALKHEILQAIEKDKADAFRIPIRMVFYGKQLPHSSSPKRHIRLFKRAGASFSSKIVHEKVILPRNARIQKLTLPILHQSFRDISHALYKMNRYSSYTARERLNKGKKGSSLVTILGSLWMFLRCYIIQRGFMDGRDGFVMAVLSAQGTLSRGLKQLYPDKSLIQMHHANNENLDRKNTVE